MAEAKEDGEIFARAVELILAGDLTSGRSVLATLPIVDPVASPARAIPTDFPAVQTEAGPKPNNLQRFRIYKRDGWRCRYCYRMLVVPPVLRQLRVIYPEFLGLRPGHHMKSDEIEPAVNRVYPNVDHVHPQSRGGSNTDDNLVAACTVHNEIKNDRSDWLLLPIRKDSWDGLCSKVEGLVALTQDFGDADWLRVLGMKNRTQRPREAEPRSSMTPPLGTFYYLVTDRGGRDRSYPTLVELEADKVDEDLHKRAKSKAARLSAEINSCGTDVSAFRLSSSRLKRWLDLEARLEIALLPPEQTETVRQIKIERQAFLNSL